MWTPIVEPVPPDLARQLRQAVLTHNRSETRRIFPPALNVAAPSGVSARLPLDDEEPTDHALRTDVVEAMCRRVGASTSALVWVSRSGDLAWRTSTSTGWPPVAPPGPNLALSLHMVVVTRRGWSDPASGATRTWARLR